MTNDTQSFAELVADRLGEKIPAVKLQILLITKEIGQEETLRVIEKAQEAFKNGEMIKDGSRKRTLGGCFFSRLPFEVMNKSRNRAAKMMKAIREQEAEVKKATCAVR